MIKLNFIKDRVKADQLSETGRQQSVEPRIQPLPSTLTTAQREQVAAISYFFKTWCGHSC